jgi:hypothetical protein
LILAIIKNITVRRYVYQKAYVEFFCSPEAFEALRPKLDAAASVTYLAASKTSEMVASAGAGVNTVSWGVFTGEEISQDVWLSVCFRWQNPRQSWNMS